MLITVVPFISFHTCEIQQPTHLCLSCGSAAISRYERCEGKEWFPNQADILFLRHWEHHSAARPRMTHQRNPFHAAFC